MPCISTIYRYMYKSTYLVAVRICDAQLLHQLRITNCNRYAIYNGTVTADFFHIGDTLLIDFFSIGILQALADRMAGIAFSQGCILQYLILRHCIMMHTTHFKNTFCQSTCLVKNYIFNL